MGDSSIESGALASNGFVGHERELAELATTCEAGADGDAHRFLIYGESGIGKTRLADELASRVKARGMQVLWGRCCEGDGAPVLALDFKCADHNRRDVSRPGGEALVSGSTFCSNFSNDEGGVIYDHQSILNINRHLGRW